MMTEGSKYHDKRSAFWAEEFRRGAAYEDYLRDSDPVKAQKWTRMAEQIPSLSAERAGRLSGHDREMNILVLSGIWCGDCVRQGPMLVKIAEACGPKVRLRWVDRDASPELRDELRIMGGARVPVVVFLSEDFFEIGRFGDRLLSAYRGKAALERGAACATGIVVPPADELSAAMGEWADIFERMLLMLRLAPMLRERYGD
jgi:hypothetical protein